MLEQKIEERIFDRLEQRFTKLLQKRFEEEDRRKKEEADHQPEAPEGNHLFWNINAMSVLCWKGWDWPIEAKWNNNAQRFEREQSSEILPHPASHTGRSC